MATKRIDATPGLIDPVSAPALAVRMRRINKRFGAVLANADVDLSVAAGHAHGIVGENGAGKSD